MFTTCIITNYCTSLFLSFFLSFLSFRSLWELRPHSWKTPFSKKKKRQNCFDKWSVTDSTLLLCLIDIVQNKEFYMSAEVRPPFTYAALIRQVRNHHRGLHHHFWWDGHQTGFLNKLEMNFSWMLICIFHQLPRYMFPFLIYRPFWSLLRSS